MIALDLDGVFADFHGAVQFHCPNMTYDLDSEQIWQKIETIPHFFATLKMLPRSYMIYDLAHDIDNDVQFLTALPRLTGKLVTAQRDKVEWVRRNIYHDVQVNCVANWELKKHFCYSPADILIDDSERNIVQWREAGGIGILHTSVEDTLRQLNRLK